MRIGSLFSGIGGLELGLERAGLGAVEWQVEHDPFCRLVLEKHWPHARRYGDVRTVHAPPPVDLMCGGFPCQDIATHGSRLGLAGKRSGLWSEYRRLIDEVRPAWIVIENVEALRRRGLGIVLGDLSALGFDAEWQTLRSADVGAPCGRARLFVVARARSERRAKLGTTHDLDWNRARGNVANRRGAGFPPSPSDLEGWTRYRRETGISPGLRRGTHGVSDRVDRIGALGNAVVPALAEVVGEAIALALG